jgi:hypothetical protein
MSLATFERRVSRAIKRGKVFDNDIPAYAKDAVKTLEKLRNWKHMWTEEEQTLAIDASTRTITDLKSVDFVKRKLTDGTLVPMKKVSPSQVLSIEAGLPGAFWMSSQTTIQFDAAPESAITLRYGYWTYSSYDNSLPWLDVEENLLVAQTVLEMSPLLRNPKLTQTYSDLVSAKISILEDVEIESEYAMQDQRMIPYADEMDEWLGAEGDY